MPNLSEHHDLISQLERKDAVVILKLIDLKTESDMDKVLNAFQQLNQRLDMMNIRIDTLDKTLNTRIDTLDKRIDTLDKSVDVRIASFEKSVNAQFKALHWVIGIFFAIAVAAAKFL